MTLTTSLLPSNSPPDGNAHYFYEGENVVDEKRSFFSFLTRALFKSRPEPQPQSQYFALVPLDDYRLRPRRTKLLVALFSVLALLMAALVFVCVPRGVSVGSIEVETLRMTWNKTLATYQLQLQLTIPIQNPNYVPVRLDGNISVAFYDAMAGNHQLQHAIVPRRSEPYMMLLPVDASNVPQQYTFTILEQCSTFPRKLIFLLSGKLRAAYLLTVHDLPTIDSYFIVECKRDS